MDADATQRTDPARTIRCQPLRRRVLCGGAIVLAALLPYLGTLGHGLVWDDLSLVVSNPALDDWSRLGEILTTDLFHESQEEGRFDYWRPLVVLSHMVERALFGDRPSAFHAVNLVLHASASLLVFLLGLETLKHLGPAMGAGLLFAVHPIHVEAVAWVSGRSDLLLGVLVVLALVADWRAAAGRGRSWQALSLLTFAAALFSKETAVVFPVLVAARSAITAPPGLRGAKLGRRVLKAALPSLLLLTAYLLIRYGLVGVAPPAGPAAGTERMALFWTWWTALALYLRLLVWPAGLTIAHDPAVVTSPWSLPVAAGLLALIALLWATARLRRKDPGASWGLLLIVVSLAPLSNFALPIGSHRESIFPFAERFLYLPSVGFCLLAAWLLYRALSALTRSWRLAGNPLTVVLLAMAVIAGGARSWHRSSDWRDEVSLFAATVRDSPGSSMARLNYGAALKGLAEQETDPVRAAALLDDAARQYRRALTLSPNDYRIHYDLGNLQLVLGDRESAEASFRKALRLYPGLFEAMLNLGSLLAERGDLEAAHSWFLAAERVAPQSVAAKVNRAHVLQMLGRIGEAVSLYEEALSVEPDLPAAQEGLRQALAARPLDTGEPP